MEELDPPERLASLLLDEPALHYYIGPFNSSHEPHGEGSIIHPGEHEACWKGTFVDGQLTGKGFTRTHKWSKVVSTYEGDFVDSKKEGWGKEIHHDSGLQYQGQFQNDQPHGLGACEDTEQHVLFEGEYVAGRRCGLGAVFDAFGRILVCGSWDGHTVVDQAVPRRCFHLAKRLPPKHHDGDLFFPGHHVYRGAFTDQLRPHGHGTMRNYEGRLIAEGEWRHGTLGDLNYNLGHAARRAVSLEFLIQFAKDGRPDATTGETVRERIVPATADAHCRFAETLPLRQIGRATYFISHSWSATFTDTVTAIQRYCELHSEVGKRKAKLRAERDAKTKAAEDAKPMDAKPKHPNEAVGSDESTTAPASDPAAVPVAPVSDKSESDEPESEDFALTAAEKAEIYASTFCWVDIFAVNQHDFASSRQQRLDLDQLESAVRDATAGTLMVVDPAGAIFRRIWCLFEAQATARVRHTDELLMCFYNEVGLFGSPELRELLKNVDVQAAASTVPADRERILEAFEQDEVDSQLLGIILGRALARNEAAAFEAAGWSTNKSDTSLAATMLRATQILGELNPWERPVEQEYRKKQKKQQNKDEEAPWWDSGPKKPLW